MLMCMLTSLLQIWGGAPSPQEFFTHYVSRGVPVIFRNALSNGTGSLRHLLSRETFLSSYGKEQVPVSAIPYARSFGKEARLTDLEQVVTSDGTGFTPDEAPMYAFNVALPAWRGRIERDVGVPSLLQGLITDYELQFYLGEAGTGAPVHFHGHAVNSLAHGEKVGVTMRLLMDVVYTWIIWESLSDKVLFFCLQRWFLFPPERAFYSTQSSLEFVRRDHRAQGISSQRDHVVSADGGTDSPLEEGPETAAMLCTQKAGDLIFVPTLWGHGTLNTMQSIGVAHEFSVEDICME